LSAQAALGKNHIAADSEGERVRFPHIRGDGRNTPVLMLTAHAFDGLGSTAKAMGMPAGLEPALRLAPLAQD
jgi:hypothetical protein